MDIDIINLTEKVETVPEVLFPSTDRRFKTCIESYCLNKDGTSKLKELRRTERRRYSVRQSANAA